MTETQVSFLYQAASILPENNKTQQILRSFYLMKCKEITGGIKLPTKYFSDEIRCPHCFMEWKTGTQTKITPVKLTKEQKRKQLLKLNKNFHTRQNLSRCKNLEQTCVFCGHKTVTLVLKWNAEISNEINTIKKPKEKKKAVDNKPTVQKINVYAKSKEAFSLHNKNNILPHTVKEQPKIIKNNKKKKDKFAGLCQQAVLASAKLKEEKLKQDTERKEKNRLSMFLKPST